MRLDDVKKALAGHGDELKSQGVKSLAVFGSVARGDAGPDSDVDFLVEFDRSVGLFHFIHVKHLLGDLLEGIVLHAFEGKAPFSPETLAAITDLKKVYHCDLTAADSHKLRDAAE